MSTIPNMTVVMPSDYVSAKKLVKAAAQMHGPVYLRFTRDAMPVLYEEDAAFTIGKAVQLRQGGDVAILANGDTVHLALKAAEALSAQGVQARVLDVHTVKPLDVEAVRACVDQIGKIVTVEDHNVINGLGSAVCCVAAEMGRGVVRRIGIPDRFGMSAPYQRLLEITGITAEHIVSAALEIAR